MGVGVTGRVRFCKHEMKIAAAINTSRNKIQTIQKNIRLTMIAFVR